jgi:hypothetical protein
MTRARLLQPKIADAQQLFHWTNFAKATTAVKNNSLSARRWEHYIESEDRMVKGSSWSKDPNRWQFSYTVRFRIDPSKVANNKFEINGDRVYYQTKAMKGQGNPEQYKVYKAPPNETFIEGTILDLRRAIIGVYIKSDFNYNGLEEYFVEVMEDKEWPEEDQKGKIITSPQSLTA